MPIDDEANKGFTKEKQEAMFLEDMQASGLSQKILEDNGVKVFDGLPEKLAAILNIDIDFAIYLCLHHTIVLFPNSASCRVKLIPAYTRKDGGQIKYMQPTGVPTRPYIIESVWSVRKDVAVDLFIVEGEKKALLLNQEGFPAIALPGIYNFRNSSETEAESVDLQADLRAFTWGNRNVYIAFDADFRTNKQVRQAMFELAFRLEKDGATVKIVTWDASDGKGIDDYVVGMAAAQEVASEK